MGNESNIKDTSTLNILHDLLGYFYNLDQIQIRVIWFGYLRPILIRFIITYKNASNNYNIFQVD